MSPWRRIDCAPLGSATRTSPPSRSFSSKSDTIGSPSGVSEIRCGVMKASAAPFPETACCTPVTGFTRITAAPPPVWLTTSRPPSGATVTPNGLRRNGAPAVSVVCSPVDGFTRSTAPRSCGQSIGSLPPNRSPYSVTTSVPAGSIAIPNG